MTEFIKSGGACKCLVLYLLEPYTNHHATVR